MMSRIEEVLPTVNGVAICGTFPPGVGDVYAKIASWKDKKFLLLLDSYRGSCTSRSVPNPCIGVEPALLSRNVDILKINLSEFKSLTGKDSAVEAANECFQKYGLSWIAIT